jgi:hypothetical protein
LEFSQQLAPTLIGLVLRLRISSVLQPHSKVMGVLTMLATLQAMMTARAVRLMVMPVSLANLTILVNLMILVSLTTPMMAVTAPVGVTAPILGVVGTQTVKITPVRVTITAMGIPITLMASLKRLNLVLEKEGQEATEEPDSRPS